MNIAKLSDQDIQSMFEAGFETVAQYNNIGDFETRCLRTVGNSGVKIEVMIVGLAGSPTIDDFKNGKVEKANEITTVSQDGEELVFKLVPSETAFLNSNDYIAVYASV